MVPTDCRFVALPIGLKCHVYVIFQIFLVLAVFLHLLWIL